MPSDRLAELTHAMWSEHLATPFRLRYGDGQTAELTLIEVTELGGARQAAPGMRAPYGLIFRAATREFLVPQNVYPLSHPALGELEIFIVPLGPDERGMRFEAIFA